jgi:hypothetical protein
MTQIYDVSRMKWNSTDGEKFFRLSMVEISTLKISRLRP